MHLYSAPSESCQDMSHPFSVLQGQAKRAWVVAGPSLEGSPPSELPVTWRSLETFLNQVKSEKSGWSGWYLSWSVYLAESGFKGLPGGQDIIHEEPVSFCWWS